MARKILVRDGELTEIVRTNHPSWFHLPDAARADVNSHLAKLTPLLREISRQAVTGRCGQCLELSIYRALCAQPDVQYLGRFLDFDPTVPTRPKKLYRKEEPPRHFGNQAIQGEHRLDFLYLHPTAGLAGFEAKNLREWLYPHGNDVKRLLLKCVALNCVPVLVARRLPRVTSEVLETCGVILHQTLNQLYCVADKDLAGNAMRQDLLGFDDIRVGDKPDARLLCFIGTTLPEVLPVARTRFEKFKDLLAAYAHGKIQYTEFAGRVLLRAAGKEEADWEDDSQDHPHDDYY
ncbi:MAG: hypothetical protein OXP09_18985 [Gammaproteobacteria bacterium]|nr:hypothetical protein [Gammaproteobacteria bacterium]MDE0367650.1 hypothetical protein [Gammaproteobacteria bacterium]